MAKSKSCIKPKDNVLNSAKILPLHFVKDKGIPNDPRFAPDLGWAIFKPVLVRKKL